MRTLMLASLVLFAAGCVSKDPMLPPVPAMPDDLATWATPIVVPLPPVQPLLEEPPPQESSPPVARTAKTGRRGPNARPAPDSGPPLFTEGAVYSASVAVGYPLTVLFEPGERLMKLVGGDRGLLADGEVAPWAVTHTPPEAPRQHVFVTCIRPGLAMGLAIATDRRTYLLNLKSVGTTTTRALRWTYPAPPVTVQPAPPPGPLPRFPLQLHVGYEVTTTHGHRPEWVPVVVDDGWKMYLVFPVMVAYQEVPLLRGIGPNGPHLLNSRQVGRVIVVDQLASRLELRLGIGAQAEVVQVVRGVLETIQCPGHAQCPTW